MRRHSRCCAIRNVGIVPQRLCTHTQRVTWYLHTHFHTVTWYLYTHFHSHVVFAHTLPQSRGICTHTSTQSRDIYERHVLIDRVECFIGYTWTVLPHGWSVSQSEMFWTFKHWKQYKCCSEKKTQRLILNAMVSLQIHRPTTNGTSQSAGINSRTSGIAYHLVVYVNLANILFNYMISLCI